MTDEIIESLIAAICDSTAERDKHILREALRSLVRLAQAEQVLSIQRDLDVVNSALSERDRF